MGPTESRAGASHVAVASSPRSVTGCTVARDGGRCPAYPASNGLEWNVDRPGSDYRSFDLPSPSPEMCQSTCMNEPQCVAFTYVNPGVQGPNARCWLKNVVPQPVPQACCVSGIEVHRARPPPPDRRRTAAAAVGWQGAAGRRRRRRRRAGSAHAAAGRRRRRPAGGHAAAAQPPPPPPRRAGAATLRRSASGQRR